MLRSLSFLVLWVVGALLARAADDTYMLVFDSEGERIAVASVPLDGVGLNYGNMSSLLLSDGSYASVNDHFRWTCEVRPDGGFYLRTVDGQWLLPQSPSGETGGAGLQMTDTNEGDGYWTLTDGRLAGYATPDAEPRFLIFNRRMSARGFTSCTPAELAVADTNRLTQARIVPAAAKRSLSRDARGVVTLEGGWSFAALCALAWDSIAALDLTRLTLPPWPVEWNARPAGCNALVYVSEAQRPLVASSWKNVILRRGDGRPGCALTPIGLTDGAPVCVPYAFRVGADSLTFRFAPVADGYWESLYLPFAVTEWPADFALAVESAEGEPGTLHFEYASRLPAYTPAIFRYTGHVSPEGTITLTAAAGVVEATPEDVRGGFTGTLQRVDVSSVAQQLYLLGADGTHFTLAAAGSYVAPFRCYYRSESAAPQSRISIGGTPTSVSPVRSAAGGACTVYSLDGRCIARGEAWQTVRQRLAPGTYVVNGRVQTVR